MYRQTVFTDELPDIAESSTIYILGTSRYLWSVAMLCPCGCGELLQMSLHEDGYPRWKLIQHEDGTVSLDPSVSRIVGCRSHFWLQRSQVQWC
jgi:hypothetical protein